MKHTITRFAAGLFASALLLNGGTVFASYVEAMPDTSQQSVSVSQTRTTPSPVSPIVPAIQDESAVLTSGKAVTEGNVLELLYQIEKDWPSGTVWGTRCTPGTHKNEVPGLVSARVMHGYSVSNTYGCGAYASMVSSLIFGDADNPARKLEDPSQMRPGDMVFVRKPDGKVAHVVVALESPNSEGRFHYTDGNHGGTVSWPDLEHLNVRSYSLNGFSNGRYLEVWTRYPESVPAAGTSVEAWHSGT